jgi:hypothetical protein
MNMEKSEFFYENGVLNNDGVCELRHQVKLGSIYVHDYNNDLGLTAESVSDFFDGFLEYTSYEASELGGDMDDYDNDGCLRQYYSSLDHDPFVKDITDEEKEDRRLREEKSFVKVGAIVRIVDDDRLYFVKGIESNELWDNLTYVTVQNGNKKHDVFLEDIEEPHESDRYEVERLTTMRELFNKYQRDSWQRAFFQNCMDDLYYGCGWGWIKENDGFVKEHNEAECKEVFDTAYQFMAMSD